MSAFRIIGTLRATALLAVAAAWIVRPAAAQDTIPRQLASVRVCVIQAGELAEVEAAYNPATGDTTYAGRPFATAFATESGYALGASWFINNEEITLAGRRYVKYGLPRVLGIGEVQRAGEYQGVGVFTEAGAQEARDVIYLPVRPGCEFQPYQTEQLTVDADDDRRAYHVVTVYYATDRRRTGEPQPSRFYGGARGRVEYGTARVSIPRRHRAGELESPVWFVAELMEDPDRHIVLQRITPMAKEPMFAALQRDVSRSGERAVLVFVHGYNVTFRDAARRTAQIAHDLRFQGVPVMYSWPSDGSTAAYTRDEQDAEWATPNFRQFLEDVARRSGATRVHLIAHSMGNRVLTGALREIARGPNAPRFNQVILSAPDIDAAVFARDIVPGIRGVADRVTLYASSRDRALRASREVHGEPRAGESGSALVVVPGIDTIDASNVDTDLMGHSYFAETEQLIDDIFGLIRHGHDPDGRRLEARQRAQMRYWLLPR